MRASWWLGIGLVAAGCSGELYLHAPGPAFSIGAPGNVLVTPPPSAIIDPPPAVPGAPPPGVIRVESVRAIDGGKVVFCIHPIPGESPTRWPVHIVDSSVDWQGGLDPVGENLTGSQQL